MISQTIDRTLEILDLSHRGLARLIGVDVHTITNNKGKGWEELTPGTRKKLGAVCILVTREFSLYRASVIQEILGASVFQHTDGASYSVLSALASREFGLEEVVEIGKLAERAYRERSASNALPVPEGRAGNA